MYAARVPLTFVSLAFCLAPIGDLTPPKLEFPVFHPSLLNSDQIREKK